jgi:uncharacterized protein
MLVTTVSGKRVDVANMRPEDVCCCDIAHALSNICRFGGHTPHFYSVAQHSIVVADMLPKHLRLAGLLHDAAEAYVGDMVAPLKHGMISREYSEIEDAILRVIGKRFDVDLVPKHPAVRLADRRACLTEFRDVMGLDWRLYVAPSEAASIAPSGAVLRPLDNVTARRLFSDALRSLLLS